MKTIIFILSCFLLYPISGQDIIEKEIETKVSEVTVFLEGAQVTRSKTIDIQAGTTIIKFSELSPFIDSKSVQVKAEGQITVLSVNHQQNFLEKLDKPKELVALESQLEDVLGKIDMESTFLVINREELAFLQANKDIGGRNQEVSVSNLKETSEFYGSKLKSLKLEEIERNKTLKELNIKRNEIQNQINTMRTKKEYPKGEVLVKVNAEKAAKVKFELSYIVANASWFPSYDIRAKNINEPVELIYKANVRQDTKIEWKDVKIKFSSSDPNVSGVTPELKPYFLSYNMLPPNYRSSINSVKGRVYDQSGIGLPGVNISVEGSTIGTVSDMNGNYSLTLPANAQSLSFNYVGYNSQSQAITNPVLNVMLQENMMALEEVVVTGYGAQKKSIMPRTMQSQAAELDAVSDMKIRGAASMQVPTGQVENQTTVNFEINTAFTVKSDNKNYTVDMAVYNLPAQYQYYCIPKIDKDAFLIAGIVDWEKYNLLEGEANVFFEDTYVGKTLMDVRYANDTLSISLGRDKNVSVKREKVKDYTTRQFIGAKKEETRTWKTTVKNNKSQEINMVILDQVPVSMLEEIEVEVQKISGGVHNKQTGEIKWKFNIKPAEQKDFELRYAVKYPKNRNLVIE